MVGQEEGKSCRLSPTCLHHLHLHLPCRQVAGGEECWAGQCASAAKECSEEAGKESFQRERGDGEGEAGEGKALPAKYKVSPAASAKVLR